MLGGVAPTEYFLIALVSPLVYNFAVDSDGVNDNRGTLPGYGVTGADVNVSNIFASVTDFFNDIINYFSMFINIILKIFAF